MFRCCFYYCSKMILKTINIQCQIKKKKVVYQVLPMNSKYTFYVLIIGYEFNIDDVHLLKNYISREFLRSYNT